MACKWLCSNVSEWLDGKWVSEYVGTMLAW